MPGAAAGAEPARILTVDATWGTISPMQLAPGVTTVGELEVIHHIEARMPLVDTRLEHFYRDGTIPTALNIPHERIAERIASLEPRLATVFFCNGPQCAATPDAICTLLANGYPPGVDPLLPRRHARLDDPRPTNRAAR